MEFSSALDYIKMGKKVAREGWNGKAMFIFLVPGSVFKVSGPPPLGIYHSHIDIRTADGMIVPWLASQTDLLAEDWVVVN